MTLELKQYMKNNNTKKGKSTLYENTKLDVIEKILML